MHSRYPSEYDSGYLVPRAHGAEKAASHELSWMMLSPIFSPVLVAPWVSISSRYFNLNSQGNTQGHVPLDSPNRCLTPINVKQNVCVGASRPARYQPIKPWGQIQWAGHVVFQGLGGQTDPAG
eukprot:EG_transcript_41494